MSGIDTKNHVFILCNFNYFHLLLTSRAEDTQLLLVLSIKKVKNAYHRTLYFYPKIIEVKFGR